jgi:hypothetical protein
LYTEETTLYRDLNRAIREYDDSAEYFLRSLEPDLGLGMAAKFGSFVPDGFRSLACYYTLLEQVLREWPKLGPKDVYRGMQMDSGAIEEYAEHVGDVVRWSGLVSTSLSRRVAARFGNVLFVFHAADCACIADAAAHRAEREVLLLPDSYFVILRVTRDSFGGAEIELRDVYTDPDLARPLTPGEARLLALDRLRNKVGAHQADQLIDQPEGVALVNMFLGNPPDVTEEDIGRGASRFLAESAAYRANPGRDDEIRARQRVEALRQLREDPEALFAAARSPTTNAVRRVIAARAALDARDEYGLTAATFAARAGSWQALALLIDAGADVTVSRDRDGRTALHYAANRGHARAVRVLLGAGVELDARDSEGKTALMLGTTADKLDVLELSRSCSALVLR